MGASNQNIQFHQILDLAVVELFPLFQPSDLFKAFGFGGRAILNLKITLVLLPD